MVFEYRQERTSAAIGSTNFFEFLNVLGLGGWELVHAQEKDYEIPEDKTPKDHLVKIQHDTLIILKRNIRSKG